MTPEGYEVVVIGGGAAGLSGALTLARSRRSVAVVDAGTPRNALADGVHGLLGHDGVPPAELLARGRAEVERYGGTLIDGEATATDRDGDGFRVTLADGRVLHAQRLLVTTGLVDELPELPGLQDRWGREVLHCPYCHGWEVRDRAIAVVGTSPASVHLALSFRQLSDHVTYLSHEQPPSEDEAEELRAMDIEIMETEVAGLDHDGERLTAIRLADGTTLNAEAVVVSPRLVANMGFLAGVGVTPMDHPAGVGQVLPVDKDGRTDVPGLWAAGNVIDPAAPVSVAAAGGANAAMQINADLVLEQTKAAVVARRAGSAARA